MNEEHEAVRIGGIPQLLAATLICCGNFLYGKNPSYLKFRSIEIIARVPYQSWAAVCFTLFTWFFSDEKRALKLSKRAVFAEYAQANETMHVVVISSLVPKEERVHFFLHTVIPVFFAFTYFWFSYFLYLVRPRWSYELNYLFEHHAYTQYDSFLALHADMLKRKEVHSEFLMRYGRTPQNQYEFFTSIRDDEKNHRDRSLELSHNT